MERHQVELDAPGFGRAGTVIRYGHWGRPVLVFPSERAGPGTTRATAWSARSPTSSTRGRCKLYCVDSFDEQTWSDSSSRSRSGPGGTARYASWILDHVVPSSARTAPAPATRSSPAARWAPTTRSSSHSPAPTCSRWHLPERQLRPGRLERLGRSRRGGVLHQPQRLRRAPPRRPPRLAAAAAARRPGRRRGTVGDPPDRLAAVRAAPRRAAGREGHPARARHLGPRLRARLGLVAEADRAPPAAVLLTLSAPTPGQARMVEMSLASETTPSPAIATSRACPARLNPMGRPGSVSS